MNKNKEHWIKSSWAISIGTAIFSLLLTIAYDYFKEKPVLSTIWAIIRWIKNLTWNFLNFDLKIWWIIVAFILLTFIIKIINNSKIKETSTHKFHDYREGKFKKWRWTWSWRLNNIRKAWIISDMKAHCPNCDTAMIDYSSTYYLEFGCPRCDFKAHDSQCDEPQKIERIILDDIDRKNL